jgi:hypothetical protein
MKVEKVYEWFGNLTYLEQHKLTDKYFNSVNPTRLANGQVLEIYIEEQVNVTLGSVSVSYLLELMTIHLETREELNHANNSTDTYIDGKVDLANAILKLVDVNSR